MGSQSASGVSICGKSTTTAIWTASAPFDRRLNDDAHHGLLAPCIMGSLLHERPSSYGAPIGLAPGFARSRTV